MRKMKVLGVELRDYSVRESMKLVDRYLCDGLVSTIAFITKKGLMAANESPETKEFMDAMDLTVAADADILRAGGVTNWNRLREVENNEFLVEFLKKLVRGRKTVYLLAETAEKLGALESALRKYQPGLQICGGFSFDKLQADEDFLINEINVASPNTLISQLPSPRREEFFQNNHMKLNTEIWLILKEGMTYGPKSRNILARISEIFTKKIFNRELLRYSNSEKEITEKKETTDKKETGE